MTLAAFLALLAVQIMATISPGPAAIVAARTGMMHGRSSGIILAAGIGAGAVIWAAAALFGLALLLRVAPSVLIGLKLVGGAYLVWLGIQIWRDAATPMPAVADERAPAQTFSAFWRGVATQLANPKPVLFFGAIFSAMVPQGTSVGWLLALLLMVFTADFLWNAFVAHLFSRPRTRMGYLSLKSVIDRVFGVALALIGTKMALI